MKISLFEQAPYRYLPADFGEHYELGRDDALPRARRAGEDARVDLLHVEELLHAARAGFDGIGVSEHSQASYDMSPNPNLVAAIVAHTTQVEGLDIAITVLGRSLGKSREPLKIAEEYALIDCISGGRLIAGMPVGPELRRQPQRRHPADRDAGARPRAPRADREGVVGDGAVRRGTAGTRVPSVNIWPRPIQQPRPPFWVPGGGTPGTLRDILRTTTCSRTSAGTGRSSSGGRSSIATGTWPRRRPRPQPLPGRLHADRRRGRNRRAGRAGVRPAPALALPQRHRRDPADQPRRARLRRAPGARGHAARRRPSGCSRG